MVSSERLSNKSLNPPYSPSNCFSVSSLLGVFLSSSVISLALFITSSAYRLPSPFIARVLTTSLSESLNISLNSFSVAVIGLIPLSSGNAYSIFELMSLVLKRFLLRGKMILLSSSKRIMFPLSNNSTIIV